MEMVKSDRNPYVESSDPYVKFSEACQMCSVQNTLGMGMDLLECWPVGQSFLQEASSSCARAE